MVCNIIYILTGKFSEYTKLQNNYAKKQKNVIVRNENELTMMQKGSCVWRRHTRHFESDSTSFHLNYLNAFVLCRFVFCFIWIKETLTLKWMSGRVIIENGLSEKGKIEENLVRGKWMAFDLKSSRSRLWNILIQRFSNQIAFIFRLPLFPGFLFFSMRHSN